MLSHSDLPQKVDVIVCLNGPGPERIKKSASLYHQGFASNIILTASKNKDPLLQQGLSSENITLAPGPKTTYQDALVSVPLLHKGKYRSALIVTNPYHLYRVRWTFYHVLNNSSVHLLFVSTDLAWNKDFWWKDKKSRFYVISEVSKIGYYWILHGFLRIEEDPPWAIELKTRYEKWLGRILL
ncbi:MAG: YdcF family protein [Thermodesulfobacteriota bacterium]